LHSQPTRHFGGEDDAQQRREGEDKLIDFHDLDLVWWFRPPIGISFVSIPAHGETTR
jgi:hypothetical protein